MAKAGGKKKEAQAPRSIENRKARFDFAIESTYEAGVELVGSEVKSLYNGRAHLTDSFCRVLRGELWLINADVEPYEKTTVFQHERRRDRKLLMHRKEINTLERKSLEKGFALVPLKMYFNEKGRVKVLIGLGKGKAHQDKRDTIAKRDSDREVARVKAGKLEM
jgi:SsrA-binding protein